MRKTFGSAAESRKGVLFCGLSAVSSRGVVRSAVGTHRRSIESTGAANSSLSANTRGFDAKPVKSCDPQFRNADCGVKRTTASDGKTRMADGDKTASTRRIDPHDTHLHAICVQPLRETRTRQRTTRVA